MFLFFQIKVCSSTISTGCEGIHEISEKLKNLSSKGEKHIVEDIKVIVDVVEKIVTHVDLSNIEKTPKVRNCEIFEIFKKYASVIIKCY